ncbi:MAG: redoxin domain-containing protein [Patescibacteria group bacterium]|nr:redoxin domain-containing protein [Patescibacteria group bacterium]
MKKIWKKYKFLVPIFVIVIVVTVGYMAIYANNPYPEIFSLAKTVMHGPMVNQAAPEFTGLSDWLNTVNGSPVKLSDLKGKVVLVDFWTYNCINCQRDIPYVNQWYDKYHNYGFEVIGVHTPEFRFEQNLDNVKKAVSDYGIKYPVALDNNYQTWRVYQNHYWPAKYLIDANGQIVFYRFGEGAYDVTEQKIQELLQQATLLKVEQAE